MDRKRFKAPSGMALRMALEITAAVKKSTKYTMTFANMVQKMITQPPATCDG